MLNPYKYTILEYLLFFSHRVKNKRLKNAVRQKTIVITGASYGIGESLAYLLAETQARLILVARTKEKLLAVKEHINNKGGNAEIFPTDITQQAQLDELIHYLKTLEGGVDIFVNNAGKSIRRSIEKSLERYHDFTRTMSLNYHGPVQLMLALIPILKANKGQVINVSAVNVLLAPAPYWAAYQASKSAFDQWFRCVAPELNVSNVVTTSIYLPLVKTRMIAPTAAYKTMPAMKPEHVAAIICRSIIHQRRKYQPWWLIFGQLASVLFRRPLEMVMTFYLKKQQK